VGDHVGEIHLFQLGFEVCGLGELRVEAESHPSSKNGLDQSAIHIVARQALGALRLEMNRVGCARELLEHLPVKFLLPL
jgi:hypothetical protein